jgi:hypothetical protein
LAKHLLLVTRMAAVNALTKWPKLCIIVVVINISCIRVHSGGKRASIPSTISSAAAPIAGLQVLMPAAPLQSTALHQLQSVQIHLHNKIDALQCDQMRQLHPRGCTKSATQFFAWLNRVVPAMTVGKQELKWCSTALHFAATHSCYGVKSRSTSQHCHAGFLRRSHDRAEA